MHQGLTFTLVFSLAVAVLRGAEPDAVDRYVERQMARQNIPGLSLAIVRDGKVIKARGYGLADVELGVPATERSVYQWGSITKMFTATAVMLLVQDGKLQLSDPISKFYEKSPSTWSNVTVRHLLTHTSGIKSYTSLPTFGRSIRKDYEPDELLALVRDLPLEFEPGEKWDYSNSGFFLLGLVIEKVSGMSYSDFLQSRIFGPLGMTTARVNHQFDIITNRATGYEFRSNRLVRAEFASPTQPYAAGALVGTVHDLAKWDAAFYGESLLAQKTREEMWTAAETRNGRPSGYGYGWQIGEIRKHKWVGHGGGIPGFATFYLRLLDDKHSVIVLLNGGASPQPLAVGVAGQFVDGLTLASIKPQKDNDPKLTARIQKSLTELSETKDSEILTPEFRENFSRSRRRFAALQEDLKSMKSFEFVISEEPPKQFTTRRPEVKRLNTYKLATDQGSRFYTFALTEDNRVAGFEAED